MCDQKIEPSSRILSHSVAGYILALGILDISRSGLLSAPWLRAIETGLPMMDNDRHIISEFPQRSPGLHVGVGRQGEAKALQSARIPKEVRDLQTKR